MNTPRISIIIVAYNALRPLTKTLANIACLDYKNIEVVVVDANSNDGTKDFLNSYDALEMRWVSEPDRGIYDAMNKGLAMAKGDFVWYINAGDLIFEPETFGNIFVQTADVYYGQTLMVTPDGRQLGLRQKKAPEDLSWRSLIDGMVVCHQSIIVSRKIAPVYDLRYEIASDVNWEIEVLKNASSTCNLHRVVSVFETGGESTKRHTRALRERFIIMTHHFGFFPTVWAHMKFVSKMCVKMITGKH